MPIGRLDPSRMQVAYAKDMGTARAYCASVMLNSGSILLIGGHDGQTCLDSTEVGSTDETCTSDLHIIRRTVTKPQQAAKTLTYIACRAALGRQSDQPN